MGNFKIKWILEIPDYKVEPELKEYLNNHLKDLKNFLNFSKLDLILLPFDTHPGFEKTLVKHKNYFINPSEIKNLNYIEDGFAICVPKSLLKDKDLCLILVKVFKFMKVSISHELLHKAFENNMFKKRYMSGNYLGEGNNFIIYLEEFFVEYLAINRNQTKILENLSTLREYLELNNIEIEILSDKSLQIYTEFKKYGSKDLKGLIISLLSCYYILFSCWRVVKENKPESIVLFENLWDTLLDLKELKFFKTHLTNMMKIFIEQDLTQVTDKMQVLFNQL